MNVLEITKTKVTLTMGAALLAMTVAAPTMAQRSTQKKPNIVVIWGDDIGRDNLSVFTKGMMGYQTPSIDRIANEGMLFTDAYADQSCTAGRRLKMRPEPSYASQSPQR